MANKSVKINKSAFELAYKKKLASKCCNVPISQLTEQQISSVAIPEPVLEAISILAEVISIEE